MKKLILKTLLVSVLMAGTAYNICAQDPAGKTAAFSFSFAYPLSTHGTNSAEYSNGVSLNLLTGVSRNEKYFTLSGLAAIATEEMTGVHLAGLFNSAGKGGRGLMISGIGNVVGGDYSGYQMAGVGNMAKDMYGFQFGGLFNIAKNVRGVQFGGLFNAAKDVEGLQFGGLFNIAKNVRGVQFAGILNIAENIDAPIALINIIKNGEYGIGISYNDMGSIVAQFRSGGRITYGILGLGYNHRSRDKGYVMEAGYGANIGILKWLRIKNELKAGGIGSFGDPSCFYGNYSLMLSFRIARNLELFGGPAVNYLYSDELKNSNLFPSNSLWKKYSSKSMQQIYIGYQAGIQVIL